LSSASADDKGPKVSAEQMELALRAENARLRMERDIAKKAAAYFAQDTLRGTPGFTKGEGSTR
jgi:transposase